MFAPAGPLRTARLLLRPFTPDDLDAVWDYQRRPEVARHLLWAARDRAACARALTQMVVERRLAAEGDCLSLAVTLAEDGADGGAEGGADGGAVVGQVELVWLSEQHRQGEIGYVMSPDHGGRGLATEAAAEALRLGFDELGLHRIIGRCSAANDASMRLLARLGMRREALMRGTMFVKGAWRDECVFALLRDEWRS